LLPRQAGKSALDACRPDPYLAKVLIGLDQLGALLSAVIVSTWCSPSVGLMGVASTYRPGSSTDISGFRGSGWGSSPLRLCA